MKRESNSRMNPMSSRVSLMFQKNQHLLDSLILRKAPRFVYQSDQEPIEGHIPVFTFHAAIPEWFEKQCQHCSRKWLSYTLSRRMLLCS